VDGIHAHPASVNMARKCYPGGAILVTDAISAMGLGEGSYLLGNIHVRVSANKAVKIQDQGDEKQKQPETLAGSIARMDDCVRRFRKYTGCSVGEAIEAATLHPAQCLRLENKIGSLNIGCNVDLILLDDDLRVKATIKNGQLGWSTDSNQLTRVYQ